METITIFDQQDRDNGSTMERLFVYGTLKRGFRNHCILCAGKAIRLGEALTAASSYDMINTGSSPGVIAGTYQIRGEIYEVTPGLLKSCDMLEFRYNRVLAEMAFTPAAWMYVLKNVKDHSFTRIEQIGNTLNWV